MKHSTLFALYFLNSNDARMLCMAPRFVVLSKESIERNWPPRNEEERQCKQMRVHLPRFHAFKHQRERELDDRRDGSDTHYPPRHVVVQRIQVIRSRKRN